MVGDLLRVTKYVHKLQHVFKNCSINLTVKL